MSSEGHELTQATLDRVSDTLHAAALDEDARGQVREGCLERELRHVGLGAFGELAARPKAADKAAQKAAQKAEAESRRALERANRDVATAEARRDRAADALREAEDALARARQSAAEAAAKQGSGQRH